MAKPYKLIFYVHDENDETAIQSFDEMYRAFYRGKDWKWQHNICSFEIRDGTNNHYIAVDPQQELEDWRDYYDAEDFDGDEDAGQYEWGQCDEEVA